MKPLIFSLGTNDALAERIAKTVGTSLSPITLRAFADGEQYVQFNENLRGRNVYLVQSTNGPAENWMTIFLALDAARGSSAREVTVVIPYYSYGRQSKKGKPREPISARTMANIIEALGADRVITMDLHEDSIAGFFRSTMLENLYARPVFIERLQEFFKQQIKEDTLVLVSPDAGGVKRAQSYARRLMPNAELAILHKERKVPNQVAQMKLIGDVKGKTALIIDDIFDTCGTLSRAVDLLIEHGAKEVYAAGTHGVFSTSACGVIDQSPLKKVFITDTLTLKQPVSEKVEVISVGELLGEAILRIEKNESLSALFETA
ncbi:MAG: ribose-phosphate diphosphokinase [Patescibacteria group bacterium]|mgnify:CR=1 FL=1